MAVKESGGSGGGGGGSSGGGGAEAVVPSSSGLAPQQPVLLRELPFKSFQRPAPFAGCTSGASG